ncbi:MAG: type VI secretion system contractile sheath large subunit [Deltaproteobacteria bacterium]|nr:type VI secretion system contractile sheath large subunit [Deltaproteobacteria bacterium]MBW1929812.1 type VI secretion system contractile sheath large subunit [Deltaproteobacteria bacterium]MBW2024458.1 type VI secretion system contractile sheath large subunit [Deltaproteobacteria bacterium]RLB22344.1 MAG: hypothetical protein DRG76_06900 [Deltaproteobacteria bacterium]
MDTPLLSFRILAIGPFGSKAASDLAKPIHWFTNESLDEILDQLQVSVAVSVPRSLCEDGSVELRFRSFRDFRPERILTTSPFLKNILDAREYVKRAVADGVARERIVTKLNQWPGLPELDLSVTPKKPAQKKAPASSAVEELLKMVAIPDEKKKGGGEQKELLDSIDGLLGEVLGILFASPELRELEAAWSGVKILHESARNVDHAQLGFVDLAERPLEEILDGLLSSLPLDLPTLIILDRGFDYSPRSFQLLEGVAQLCENLLVPAVVEISPEFLQLKRWEDLDKRPYIPHYLEDQAYAKWQGLRKKSSSQWVCAICNGILARYPYGSENPSGTVPFAEDDPLWVSPVWVIAALATKSMKQWGWPSRIADWKNCRLEDLPVRQVSPKAAFPTETAFSEDRILQFAKAGIVSVGSTVNRDVAFIPFDTTIGGTTLGYQLLLAMSAQFLMWCKDHFAEDLEPSEIEQGIRDILILLWEKRGYDMKDRIQVTVARSEKDGPARVALVMEPPSQVLSKADRISLEILW